MSQDAISVVPHTSSTIFRRAARTLQTHADLPMSIRSDIATPAEVHSVDPTIPVELHLMLEEFVSLVDSGDFYGTNTLLHGPIYPQTALSIRSVCYSCPCKALIQLQKDFSSFLWAVLPHFQEAF